MSKHLTTLVKIDQKTEEVLKNIWPLIEEKLPPILDDFYDYMVKRPETSAILKGHETSRLKGAQTQHWKKTFCEGFNEDYIARAKRIGEAHERIGLQPSLYIGGYQFIINRLIEAVVQSAPRKRFSGINPQFIQDAIQAINTALFTDMAQAISAYYIAVQMTAQNKMQAAVHSFQNSVSAGVDTVASATEELDHSIGTIASQVERSTHTFNSVTQSAEAAATKVSNVYMLASKINDIASFIKDISDQTNLLALNASIEAARAGDAGKGFAVVADEVKKLATSTDQATANIQEQIQEIQAGSQMANESIESVTHEMADILETLQELNSAITEQKMASGDIAHNITSIAHNTEQVGQKVLNEMKII